MLSSLLRPKKGRRPVEASFYSTPYSQQRHATADFTETDGEEEADEEDFSDGNNQRHKHVTLEEEEEEEEDEEEIEDDDEEEMDEEDGGGGRLLERHLLPIFSATHLDALPVYNLTHAIRLIILPRTETALTWDQLRSPQVSQFLIKPMQQQIRTSHFSRATLYALMANCLQFEKESQINPGTAATSRTRAMVCELLAIKLLKEFNTRELIDALSYDFFPLQGLPVEKAIAGRKWEQKKVMPAAVRISTLEIAIRASAKRFLAHPLVVQQLESIWAGTIVFHSHADSLHRQLSRETYQRSTENTPLQVSPQNARVGYGTSDKRKNTTPPTPNRRTVTLYDPRDASLFKLSRLRVPRYRQFFSTCSLAILLGLFLAVLFRRSMDITTLELFFWFWSIGFMLDEVVGFNEQGFSLYIMSFWNAFDLGILLLLTIYYSMRLYGIFLVDVGREEWNSMAYDVLATNAILLFPRLFSVLDHYRYFSQLLIAFRLMAIDLVAVFVLILIACSGFFVAFTLSFGKKNYDAAEVAFKIFQILMGFTPAAWEYWTTYNPLGKALLVLFLFICHFLVVTILITVLTNSFMAIVSNAEQEHQFVFAVNTISMVKNDELFSYVAPSNIVAWLLTPMRFCLPFRTFIKLNRTVIKATHFPLLFGIFIYEKVFLASSVFEPTDLIENRGRRRLLSQDPIFRSANKIREESIAGYQKDQALDEVFRLAPRSDNVRTTRKSLERQQTHKVVNNWMDHQEHMPSTPPEDRSSFGRLESRRQYRFRRGLSGGRSVTSDPEHFISTGVLHNDEAVDDGDDELNTHEDEEAMSLEHETRASESHATSSGPGSTSGCFAATAMGSKLGSVKLSSNPPSVKTNGTTSLPKSSPQRRPHKRNMSTNTIVFNPVSDLESPPQSLPKQRPHTAKKSGNTTPGSGLDRRAFRDSIYSKSYPRPIPRGSNKPMPFEMNNTMSRTRLMRRRRSSLEMATSQIGLDLNASGLGAVPNSFATEVAMATGALKGFNRASKGEDTDGMMGRLMLARMKTLEEGFAEVVKEFRVMRTAGNSSVEDESSKKTKKDKISGKKKKDMEKPTSDGDVGTMADELPFRLSEKWKEGSDKKNTG